MLVHRYFSARLALCAAIGVLALTGCGSASKSPAATPTAGGTPSNGPKLSVSSSITDGAHLVAPLPWSASVTGEDVTAVDFLIDGKVLWTEQNTPYFFNDDNNLLPPWLLGPGAHTLTVRASSPSGATASQTSHVTVSAAPKVPRVLLATFQRKLTQADLNSTSSIPGYDPNSHPPLGTWTIRPESNYLIALGDPTKPPGENETFAASASGDLTLAGPANWLTPHDLQGGLCEPAPADHYHWAVKGRALVITGGTNCPNRKALFDGTWVRR